MHAYLIHPGTDSHADARQGPWSDTARETGVLVDLEDQGGENGFVRRRLNGRCYLLMCAYVHICSFRRLTVQYNELQCTEEGVASALCCYFGSLPISLQTLLVGKVVLHTRSI